VKTETKLKGVIVKKQIENVIKKGNFTYNVGASLIALATLPTGKKRMLEILAVRELLNEEIKKLRPKTKKKLLKKPKSRVIQARRPNRAFMEKLTPSKGMAGIVGAEPLARTNAVSKLWDYIKKNNLQSPRNRRNIITDEKLRLALNTSKKEVSMFELAGMVGRNLE